MTKSAFADLHGEGLSQAEEQRVHVEVGVLPEAVGLGVVLVVQVVPPAGRQPLRGEKGNTRDSNWKISRIPSLFTAIPPQETLHGFRDTPIHCLVPISPREHSHHYLQHVYHHNLQETIPPGLPEDRAVPQIVLEPAHLDLGDKGITEERELLHCNNFPCESL